MSEGESKLQQAIEMMDVHKDSVNLIPIDQPMTSVPSKIPEPMQIERDPFHARPDEMQLAEEQAQLRAEEGLGQVEQKVERRLGLLKKGLHGMSSGMPPMMVPPMMSANYLAGSSDCERCLASMSQQPLAEYQQAPMEPISAPVSAPQMSYPSMPSLGLKSKLFMKFPFFMKAPMQLPMGGPADYGQQEFWSQQQPTPGPPVTILRPQSANLLIRPAHAYNCVQTAPLLAAPTPPVQQTELYGSKSAGQGLKQQQQFGAPHQQQVSYSAGSY